MIVLTLTPPLRQLRGIPLVGRPVSSLIRPLIFTFRLRLIGCDVPPSVNRVIYNMSLGFNVSDM